ncbi:hypothetical protein ANN_19935 [Periplaneta americana]|uniref:Reverse transcriptase domain-containing protein n=1 Tax=Periplaneta americana TaxID=6978 RepID=A0ABQ8SB94_PERAM|nr:hypothetical protein ANN_19935 [Periplaneta americana]
MLRIYMSQFKSRLDQVEFIVNKFQESQTNSSRRNYWTVLIYWGIEYWEKEIVPEQWKESIIVPIFKKGDKTNCGNFRGISLLLTSYKILSNILLRRLTPNVDEIIGDHQCGFRRNRSTIDQIFCIRQIMEKKWEYKGTEHQLFIDFKKAYDSVKREVLYDIFIEFGIPKKLVRLIKMCLSETYSRVRIGLLILYLNCDRIRALLIRSQILLILLNRWRSVKSVCYHNLFRTVFCAGKSYAGYLLSSIAYGKIPQHKSKCSVSMLTVQVNVNKYTSSWRLIFILDEPIDRSVIVLKLFSDMPLVTPAGAAIISDPIIIIVV